MKYYTTGDYIKGYTKAIQDITDIFDYIQDDLRYHRKNLTAKTVKKLLKCILENRAAIRERRNDGFIRWNSKQDNFEYFER